MLIWFLANQELEQREREGQLDEGFLSEVNAQLRQVSFVPSPCTNPPVIQIN